MPYLGHPTGEPLNGPQIGTEGFPWHVTSRGPLPRPHMARSAADTRTTVPPERDRRPATGEASACARRRAKTRRGCQIRKNSSGTPQGRGGVAATREEVREKFGEIVDSNQRSMSAFRNTDSMFQFSTIEPSFPQLRTILIIITISLTYRFLHDRMNLPYRVVYFEQQQVLRMY